MSPARRGINRELINRVRRIILAKYNEMLRARNHYVNESGDVLITTALTDEEIEELVLTALEAARQPVTWRELRAIFAEIAGEDRLRRILNKLKAENRIAELTKTRYALPQYVPAEDIEKIKNPGIISKVLKIKRAVA